MGCNNATREMNRSENRSSREENEAGRRAMMILLESLIDPNGGMNYVAL